MAPNIPQVPEVVIVDRQSRHTTKFVVMDNGDGAVIEMIGSVLDAYHSSISMTIDMVTRDPQDIADLADFFTRMARKYPVKPEEKP